MARKASTTEKPKVALVTLGCPKNLVDSEMMLGYLDREGFELSSSPQGSDVIVVNTCGFIDQSKAESVNKILELAEYKKSGDAKVLVATGCLTQRYCKELEVEIPEVDLFLGTGEFSKIGHLLKDHLIKNKIIARSFVSEKQILPDPSAPRVISTPKQYAYVKISEGCNHRCSFCIIPHIRGNLSSRSIESIVGEIKQGYKKGVREFNLIAQDLNEYGFDLLNDSKLSSLIEAIDQIPGKFWVRLNYMYPLEFSSQLIETIARAKKVVPYIDMPLQHINDRILMSMRRGSGSRYVRFYNRIL
jgi:ribosomal protein S12 methylthiotransferase